MEMYPNTSSFATNLTLQTPNTFRDASFSSYLNKSEENIIRNLTNQPSDESVHANYRYFRKEPEEDGELDVFGAEKYFKDEIEDVEVKHADRNEDQNDRRYGNIEDVEEFDYNLIVKRRIDQANMRTPSVRSNVSGDSRTGLLPRTIQSPGKIKTASRTRTFLGTFGCNCINSKSTRIKEKKLSYAKEISVSDQKTGNSSSKFAERKSRNESNDYFCFPALNLNSNNLTMNNLNTNHANSSSNSSNLKSGVLAGKGEGENNGGRLSLGKKLSMLHDWDVETPMEDEMYIPVAGMYNGGGGGGGDGDSDSSSDLFEIGSFSTTENSSFMAHRKSESNCYAPSEVSVDWSVVTASAADFSVVSDYEGFRSGGGGGGWRISGGNEEVLGSRYEQKRRNGLLSGCTSDKAVRVAGDEWKFSGGPVGGRRRLPESMEVGSMFRRE